MTAANAITATLTMLLMGTFSDRARSRWGRRRPFILFGYILWGISTILFPTVAYIKVSSLAIFMVVAADSLMTFFGSTANDAVFNVWTADVATSDTRVVATIIIKETMTNQPTVKFITTAFGYAIATWIGLLLLSHFWLPLQRIILDLVDRLSIFLYIFLPLGLISVFVVLIRLIW